MISAKARSAIFVRARARAALRLRSDGPSKSVGMIHTAKVAIRLSEKNSRAIGSRFDVDQCTGLQIPIPSTWARLFPWCCVPLLRRTSVSVGRRARRSFAHLGLQYMKDFGNTIYWIGFIVRRPESPALFPFR